MSSDTQLAQFHCACTCKETNHGLADMARLFLPATSMLMTAMPRPDPCPLDQRLLATTTHTVKLEHKHSQCKYPTQSGVYQTRLELLSNPGQPTCHEKPHQICLPPLLLFSSCTMLYSLILYSNPHCARNACSSRTFWWLHNRNMQLTGTYLRNLYRNSQETWKARCPGHVGGSTVTTCSALATQQHENT